MVERFDKAKARFEEVSEQLSVKKAKGETLQAFITELGKQDDLITEFDERVWYSLVDFATVNSDDDIRFTFKDGTEIKA